MNELQRQTYLSALGIENYMPRWRLPCAPEPVACVLPVITSNNLEDVLPLPLVAELPIPSEIAAMASPPESAIAVDMLANLNIRQAPATPVNATSILQQLADKKPAVVTPFSLSVWRPLPGFLIIDSRNTTLALPTDLLLNNILRAFLVEKFNLNEEVLRWPMIENRFVPRTEVDARNELQTWLAVENELRPISRIWLLGEMARQYFIKTDISVLEKYGQKVSIDGLPEQAQLTALLLPSLNELLQNPQSKALLWSAFD